MKCLGNIRNFQGKKSIGAIMICLIKDPNQIMFHYLQAITVHKAHTSANVRRSPRALSRISSGVCPGSSIRKPAPVADFEHVACAGCGWNEGADEHRNEH